jgi:polyisoprenoid-binding protein YceI
MKYRALLLLAVSGTAFSQTHVQLDPASTTINFTLGDVLHTVHGVFKLKSGVNALSGESGNDSRDSRMHKNILESAKYGEISFAPDRVEGKVNPDGDSQVRLHGQFTIHGRTHEVTMAVKSHMENQRLTATIDFQVPYVQWGMKNPSTLFLRVSDTVKIGIQTTGQLTPATP